MIGRLDAAESIGDTIATVGSAIGVRPVAARLDVPHTTARGWVRRFRARAARLWSAFGALAVELSGEVVEPVGDLVSDALGAIAAAFDAACSFPGWAGLGCWRFVSVLSGGSLLGTNTDTPYLMLGRRRFMPPVP